MHVPQVPALRALHLLAWDSSSRQHVVAESGGIELLEQVTQTFASDADVQREASCLVRNLAWDTELCSALARSACVDSLCKTLEVRTNHVGGRRHPVPERTINPFPFSFFVA